LLFKPNLVGAQAIHVHINQSALLVPGDYLVIPEFGINPTGNPPIAEISYDRKLQHFNVRVLPDRVPGDAQFSVLVNLTDLMVGPLK
jgi:hypothetical protein